MGGATIGVNHAPGASHVVQRCRQDSRPANIHGTMEFLRKYPPFNQMDGPAGYRLVEHCQLRFYAAGEGIIKPGDGRCTGFYIVKTGAGGRRASALGGAAGDHVRIASGECFPLRRPARRNAHPHRTSGRRETPSACCSARTPSSACSPNPCRFRDFALRGVSSLLDQVKPGPAAPPKTSVRRYSLDTTLRELALQQPVTRCLGDLPLRHAVRLHARTTCRQHRDRRRRASARRHLHPARPAPPDGRR